MSKKSENSRKMAIVIDSKRGAARLFVITSVAFAALSAASVQLAAGQSYAITQLDATGSATAINAIGQVCITGNAVVNSQLWTPTKSNGKRGSLQEILPLTQPPHFGIKIISVAFLNAINASGDIAGVSYSVAKGISGPNYDATIWQPNDRVLFGGGWVGTASINAIDTAGDFVGQVGNIATLWHNQVPSTLSTPAGMTSVAFGINDFGQIVGAITDSFGVSHATLWQNGNAYALGTLAGGSGEGVAFAINGSGQIVGYAAAVTSTGTLTDHAFLWTPSQTNGVNGAMSDISSLPVAAQSYALAVNSGGQIVGRYLTATGAQAAFVWDVSDGMRDLTGLLPAGSGWFLISANGINDFGQIVGAGSSGAFLLTP